jgi:VanZ family protein
VTEAGRRPNVGFSGVRAGQAGPLALLLYTTFIVYQSLANGGAWRCAGEVLATSARLSRSDVLANVLAYVPLGLLGVLVAARGSRGTQSQESGTRLVAAALGSVAVIALLSSILEVVQACQAARVSSAFDVMANAAGGALGVAAGLVLRSAPAGTGSSVVTFGSTHDARLRLLTAGVAASWALSQASPWVFAVDPGTIRSHLSFLRHWSDAPLDVWRMARHGGAWLAVGCACRLAARGRGGAIALLIVTAGASLLMQILLDAQSALSVEELAGLAAGGATVLVAMALAGATPHRTRWAAALMLGATMTIAAYQLRPDPGPVQPFGWWPQVGLGGMRGALDYALLFGWYGMAAVVAGHWAHSDGFNRAPRTWPATAILLTLFLEIAQTRIPGRGPDVSAPLFTLLAALFTIALIADAERRVG